ncbi:hypothetical protein Leryth_013634 [Lithospermum erythrorhizon]|nr:hypothetical protein Leryth_013634 [Lithospermum erythrorhizon]
MLSVYNTFIFFVSLALIPYVIHKFKHFKKNQKPSNKCVLPPGPKPLPFIGCLYEMLVNKPAFKWIHSTMEKMDTGIACFRLGRVHVIAVTSTEIAQEILLKQDSVFASRPVHMSTEIPTYGYLTVALTPIGQQWKKMRRIVTSEVLSAQRHNWLQLKRAEEADNLIRYVYNLCGQAGGDGNLVNIRTVTRHYCGNVIRRLMLNKRYFGEGTLNGGPGPEEIDHVDSLFTILQYINGFSVSDYLPWLRSFDFGGQENTLREALGNIKKYNDPEIDQRINMWKKGLKTTEDDVLDVLICLTTSDGSPLLSPSEIKAQILDLMLAAVDNPSHATEWALAEMINEPSTLERAVEEIDKVVGTKRFVQESDLPKLNYVKACAREAFRLHPVSPFNVPHLSITDTNVAGYFIPKGSQVLISRVTLGRNPKIWEDPLKFNPERHLDANGSEVALADPKLGLVSFSTGRRGCPGVLLGSTMTTMLMARLLQGFSWNKNPNVSSYNLSEAEKDLTLAEPLTVSGKPRLPNHLYATHATGFLN